MNLTLSEANALEREYGCPLYLFDEAAFLANASRFVSAMRAAYPKYRLSYSFKTNYTPYVCSLIRALGGDAEVVSAMEYELACRLGFPPERIIFNGPDKMGEIAPALLSGAMVNADHLPEVAFIADFARRHPDQQFDVGLRVNLDLGQPFVSRFGLDPADLPEAMSYVAGIPNLKVAGLHCHISRCRGLEAWRKRTEIMLSLADRFFPNKPPRYLDLGSGMFADMEPALAAQFDDIPTYEQYASVTAALVAEHYRSLPDGEKPVLLTEPGTTLINRYVSLLARVDALKTVRGKTLAILNCSEHNLGETCLLKQLPLRVIPAGEPSDGALRKAFPEGQLPSETLCGICPPEAAAKAGEPAAAAPEGIDLVGYTCLEQDVLYRNYPGPLVPGDFVLFGNVGGYSVVYKPPFIRPNCAMVAQKPDGTVHLIRRAETFEDIFATWVIAEPSML